MGRFGTPPFKNDETMRTILNNTQVIKSKRQLPNLKRLLVKSEFKGINILPQLVNATNHDADFVTLS